MDVTDWENDEIMQLIMAKGRITQKVLLESLKNDLGAIPQSTFSSKIRRNALKVKEFQAICKVLGYRIILERITN